MNPYKLGIQLALGEAGLVKHAAGIPWWAYAAAPAVGAGVGALASPEDRKRGAGIGALGGAGLAAGVRMGTGRLSQWLKSRAAAGPRIKPLEQLMANPATAQYGENAWRWMNKHIGMGALAGGAGLGLGLGAGSRFIRPTETSSDEGGLFGLTPQRASQLQGLLPVVQQIYQASQGQAPLPTLAAYSMFPEQAYAGAPGIMGPGAQ